MLAAKIMVAVVAALHLGFMFLEMVLWSKPRGRKIFGLSKEFAEQSAGLAANQGLYNGILAAGLINGLFLGAEGLVLIQFLLAGIIVAGLYGAYSVKLSILWIQAVPALIALTLLVI